MTALPALSPVCIDLSGRWLRAAQLRRARTGEALSAWAWTDRAPGPICTAEAHTLADTLVRRGMVGNRITLVTGVLDTASRVMELPPRSSGAPVDQIARVELARQAGWPDGRFEAHVWDVPRPQAGVREGDSSHVMAIGADHDRIRPVASALAAAGFELCNVEPRSAALTRSLCAYAGEWGSLLAVCDLAWEGLCLSVMHGAPAGGHVLISERTVPEAGLSRLYEACQKRASLPAPAVDALLGVGPCAPVTGDDAESNPAVRAAAAAIRPCVTEYLDQVACEAERGISYVAGRYPAASLAGLMLCGEGACLEGLMRRLSDYLQLPVSVAAAGRFCSLLPGCESAAGLSVLAPVIGAARNEFAQLLAPQEAAA